MANIYRAPDSCTYRSDKQTGKEFENDIIYALTKVYRNHPVYKIKDRRGTEMDFKEGTDVTCGEIRIDLTLRDVETKDCVPYSKTTDMEAIAGFPFKIGIRHGNIQHSKKHNGKYNGFEIPVVVIGLDMDPPVYMQHEDEIMQKLLNKDFLQQLIYEADDVLQDYTAIDKDERPPELNTHLKRNLMYSEPTGIEEKYKKRNKFQEQLANMTETEQTNDECIYPN